MKSIKRYGMAAGSKKTTGRRMSLVLAVMLAAAVVFACAPLSQSSPGWTTPENISPGATTGNQYPQIALDADGHPHAVWQGNDGGSVQRIYYSENTGSGWTTPENISPGTMTNNSEPQIALDAGGNPHVVWYGYDGSTLRIYYSENTGGTWTTPQDLTPSATDNNQNPQIALDSGGNPHVVWHGQDGISKWWVYYSENTGGTWTTPLNISPGTTDNSSSQIALDSGGNPHVVWYGRDGSLVWVIYYSENTGGAWTTPENLSTSSTTNRSPQIAVDAGGNPHVVWYGQDAGSIDRVYYSEDISTCRVTTTVAGGHGSVDPADQWVAIGGNATIDLVPDAGYQVASITDNGAPQAVADPYVITNVTAAHDVVATFAVNDFYFAEGYTGAGFQEYLCLGNSGEAPLKVKVTYLVKNGDPVERTYDVPPLSRFTADVNAEVGPDKEVSIKCEAAAPFIAERPMYFEYTGGGGSWTGGSDAVGATSISDTWYFAEGYTGPGFDEWVCVLNPGGSEAHLTFNFQTQEDGLIVPTGTYTVPAHSRATFKANDLLEGKSYQTSLKLVSDVPVVAERPMYFDYQGTGSWGWTGGHDVMGTPTLARDYFFAEGTTRAGFEEWLTLQNPGTAEITVHAAYQLGEGTPVEKDYKVSAATRKTIYVPDEVGIDKDVSVHLSSASDFLAERPMYFDYQGMGSWGWTGGHCVIGAASQGTDWFFAEGYTGPGFEEWLCIQNPGTAAAEVRITYYPQGGGAPIIKDPITVAANSRHTVFVNSDAGEGLSLCAEVASDQPVIVERPMYFNFDGIWTGGSDVVGYQP
jgi:hypothetical protein